jgi:hypothetical protein
LLHLLKQKRAFQVDYPAKDKDPILVRVTKKDLEEVQRLNKTVVLFKEEFDLDEVKTMVWESIKECMEADDDSRYVIDLLAEGNVPFDLTRHSDGDFAYAEENPDDDKVIDVYLSARPEKT